jgi:hypothetical protein
MNNQIVQTGASRFELGVADLSSVGFAADTWPTAPVGDLALAIHHDPEFGRSGHLDRVEGKIQHIARGDCLLG